MMSGVARKSMLPMLVGLKPKLSAPAASRPVERMPKSTRRMPSQVLLPERLALVDADDEDYDAADGEADDDGEDGGEHGARAVLAVESGQTLSHAVASFPWRLAPAM